ncbi:MAG TPA: rhomboid family intramembrane serine protease, partial [Urbifossiella sp.]|nr:rhomboid family intramembrane serine protease [Urbifossiella sp.]
GAPVVKWLVVLNVVVFLAALMITRPPKVSEREMRDRFAAQKDQEPLTEEEMQQLFRDSQRTSPVQEWGELDTEKVVHQGQVWRLVTSAFLHARGSVFHILLNMIALYWFGRTLEIMYGSREFLLFYLAAALCGSAAFVGLDLVTGSRVPAIGASGAVLGVMMLYTVHFPCEEIFYCFFFPMQMRWLMALYAVVDLHPVLLGLAGDRYAGGVAHAAHLGGLAFGFLYGWNQWRLAPLADHVPGRRERAAPARPARRPADANDLDRVLAKISESGADSLTAAERATLTAASARLKTRNRSDGRHI